MAPLCLVFVFLHLASIYAQDHWEPFIDPNQYGNLGQDGVVRCDLRGPGVDRLNITWNILDKQTLRRKPITPSRKYIPQGTTLTIKDLEATDSGQYGCVVEQGSLMYYFINFNVTVDNFCDFENGNCIWRDSNDGEPFWMDGAPTVRPYRGSYDHTTGSISSRYWIMDSTQLHRAGDSAIMISDTLPPASTSRCLSFWYFIKSGFPLELSVVLWTPGLNQSSVLWTMTGHDDVLQWSFGRVPLLDAGQNYNILLEGTFLTDSTGLLGIGLDDIKVEERRPNCNAYPLQAGTNLTAAVQSANTRDDGAQNTTRYDGARNTTRDDGAQNMTRDDGARNMTRDDGARNTTQEDGAENTTREDGAQNMTRDDGARNMTRDEGTHSKTDQGQGSSALTTEEDKERNGPRNGTSETLNYYFNVNPSCNSNCTSVIHFGGDKAPALDLNTNK